MRVIVAVSRFSMVGLDPSSSWNHFLSPLAQDFTQSTTQWYSTIISNSLLISLYTFLRWKHPLFFSRFHITDWKKAYKNQPRQSFSKESTENRYIPNPPKRDLLFNKKNSRCFEKVVEETNGKRRTNRSLESEGGCWYYAPFPKKTKYSKLTNFSLCLLQ